LRSWPARWCCSAMTVRQPAGARRTSAPAHRGTGRNWTARPPDGGERLSTSQLTPRVAALTCRQSQGDDRQSDDRQLQAADAAAADIASQQNGDHGGVTTYSNIRFELAKLVVGVNRTRTSGSATSSRAIPARLPLRPRPKATRRQRDAHTSTRSRATFRRSRTRLQRHVPSTRTRPLGDLTFDRTRRLA